MSKPEEEEDIVARAEKLLDERFPGWRTNTEDSDPGAWEDLIRGEISDELVVCYECFSIDDGTLGGRRCTNCSRAFCSNCLDNDEENNLWPEDGDDKVCEMLCTDCA
jgi:hypothetical protein